jgi:4-hydroxybenzoate polyprenyltransferase
MPPTATDQANESAAAARSGDPLRAPARPGSAAARASALWVSFVFGGFLMPIADALGMGALGLLVLGEFPWHAAGSIALLTFLVYALNRIVEIDIDGVSNPERTRWLRTQRHTQIVLLLAAALAGAALQLAAESRFAVLCAALWTVLGTWYCFGLKNITRHVLGFKAYLIGLMYGLWPLHMFWFVADSLPAGALEITAFVVLRMLLSTSVSDLKDTEMDRAQGLKTFATEFSARSFYRTAHALNLLSGIPVLVGILRGSLPSAAAGLLLCIPLGLFFPGATRRTSRNPRWVTAVLVDSEGLSWLAGALIANALLP